MKIKVAMFFGGKSVEHEVSVISGIQAYLAMDTEKYEVTPVYLTKNNEMYVGEQIGNIEAYKDIDALLPGVLTKVNDQETSGDKRYKAYSDLLRLECPKWFILDECLPPMREWTSKRFEYQVDDTRRRRIQQLVKDIYQGLKKEGL